MINIRLDNDAVNALSSEYFTIKGIFYCCNTIVVRCKVNIQTFCCRKIKRIHKNAKRISIKYINTISFLKIKITYVLLYYSSVSCKNHAVSSPTLYRSPFV